MAVRDFAPGVLGPQAAEWLAGRRSEPVEPTLNDDELRKLIAARTYTDGGYPFDVV